MIPHNVKLVCKSEARTKYLRNFYQLKHDRSMIKSLLSVHGVLCDEIRNNPHISHPEDLSVVIPPHLCTSAKSIQTPTSAENQTLPEF